MPNKETNPGTPEEKKTADEVDKIEEAFLRGEKLKAFKRGAGIEETPANKEDLVKEVEEAINKKIAPLEAAVAKFAEDKERKEFYGAVVEKVKEVVEKGKTAQENPLDTYEKVGKILGNVVTEMKGKLGIPEDLKTGDISGLLSLEEKKAEREQAQRQHEERMQELRQQHEEKMKQLERQDEADQKRWERDYRLRVLEFSDSRAAKGRATDTLEDLAGAVIDSLETERGVASEGEETPGRVRIPKSFKCQECGSIIEVARDHDLETPIICGKCGADYILSEMQ